MNKKKKKKTNLTFYDLTEEQQNIINLALKGENVLVDACIGSGKTTVIQVLCNEFDTNKKILYLTYNRLLKIDAKNKIKNKNVTVQNYHGFAYGLLKRKSLDSSSADAIKIFLTNDIPVGAYDLLLLDEYQDITQEISELLERIKEENPNIQIVAVGDMEQKIYDNTKLNVKDFIDKFLVSYQNTYLTRSFRMPKEYANMLGRVWNKTINGVNENCQIEYMKLDEIKEFLSKQKPSDIICLGSPSGEMSEVLNYLEREHNNIFNKNTVYASIRNEEKNLKPKKNSAIFTTYDSSKGLERPICVIFDFNIYYWSNRLAKITTNYEILRNIFCVAASRGKQKIIFLKSEILLDEEMLKNRFGDSKDEVQTYSISKMFEHKYDEDIENMRQMLDIKEIYTDDKSEIKVKTHEGLIDLTPCIGIFLEASYFNGYQIDKEITHLIETKQNSKQKKLLTKQYEDFIKKRNSIKDLTLFYLRLETNQERYFKQTQPDFVDDTAINQMHKRLSEVFSQDETIQKNCSLNFRDMTNDFTMEVRGIADVIKNNIVYELKFVNNLTNDHFLQTASYMLALNLDTSILWNVKNNEMYEIKIKNREDFRVKLAQTISKGRYKWNNLNQQNNNETQNKS